MSAENTSSRVSGVRETHKLPERISRKQLRPQVPLNPFMFGDAVEAHDRCPSDNLANIVVNNVVHGVSPALELPRIPRTPELGLPGVECLPDETYKPYCKEYGL